MFGKFSCLEQCKHFPELIHGAEPAREDDERFGELRKPQFAHEEIMEAKVQLWRNEAIGTLFMRQLNAQADRRTAGFRSAAIRGFHDARASAGTDDKSSWMLS